MNNYNYIIGGGGMTADSTVKGIREIDKSGKIAVFSEEKDPPYNRPPLSKVLWKGDSIDSIWRKTEKATVDFFTSTSLLSVDPSAKSVKASDGKTYYYEKLLLATGGRQRRLSYGGDEVIYFRTVDDYKRLRSISEHGTLE